MMRSAISVGIFIKHQQRSDVPWRINMLNWGVIFLVAIIAGLFGYWGVVGMATNIAWIIFVVGLVIALAFFLTRRRPKL